MTTLYVTEQYSIIKKSGETLEVNIPENEQTGQPSRKITIPLIKIDQVIILGDSTLTAQALAALLVQKTEITLLNFYGQFRGRVVPAESRNSLLRLSQFRAHEDPIRSFELAQQFVAGKLYNERTFLLRSNRKLNNEEIATAVESLRGIAEQALALRSDGCPPSDPGKPQAGTAWGTLQGLEGAGTARYFNAFGKLLRGEAGLVFETRNRRPPRDPVNALLSFGYTLLLQQCNAALQIVGLDAYVGYLHSSQYSKPALGLDLMEEFRTPIADSIVVTLINNRILTTEDFVEEFGAIRLKDKPRRVFLEKFEERMSTEIIHPAFKYKATYRRCIELQARLLAKTLQGEIQTYPPFKIR